MLCILTCYAMHANMLYIEGFQAREKPAAELAFNWLMTYTGKDVPGFYKECIMAVIAEGEERDVLLLLGEAVNKFLVKSDGDRDCKVLLVLVLLPLRLSSVLLVLLLSLSRLPLCCYWSYCCSWFSPCYRSVSCLSFCSRA